MPFTDYVITSTTSLILIAILVFINMRGRRAKQIISNQYKKINEQQESIFNYYENGMHLKHDYTNVLLTQKRTVDSDELDEVAVQLEKINAYTSGI